MVYVVIILAAALAFLCRGVHAYINKETLILTGVGVLVGLPAGYFLTRGLTAALKIPSLYFDTVVAWPTYIIAAALAFAFTVAVNALTNRRLGCIDMVGALKSAE